MNKSSKFAIVLVGLCAACGAESGEAVGEVAQAAKSANFSVDFSGCIETAGIGLVPYQNARALVPAHYTLMGDSNNAVIVVRTVKCDGVSVDGKNPKATTVTQIGISLVGEDASANINNYALWYVTDQGQLHAKFTSAGVNAENSQHLSYSLTPIAGGATLDFTAAPAQAPDHEVFGSVFTPTDPAVPFTATWWADTSNGRVRSRTVLPNIRFGGASTTLTAPAGSALAQLIGGTSLTFPLLDSYNTFPAAHMEVTSVP